MRPAYWWLCALWLLIIVPVLYYGIPYAGGDYFPTIDSIGSLILTIICLAVVFFPVIAFPFMREKKQE